MRARPGDGSRMTLDAFRAAVMADPAIQQTLAELIVPEEFVRIARDYAAGKGIALTAAELEFLLRPDPLGIAALAAPPLRGAAWPPLPHTPAIDEKTTKALRSASRVSSSRCTVPSAFAAMTRSTCAGVIASMGSTSSTPAT